MTIEETVEKRINKDFKKWERTHDAHIIVCWYLLKDHTFHEALCLIRAGIIELNFLRKWSWANTYTNWYYETLTQFRLRKLDDRKELEWADQLKDIESLLWTPEWKSDIVYTYRKKEELFTPKARSTWIGME